MRGTHKPWFSRGPGRLLVLLVASLLLMGVSTAEDCAGGGEVEFEELLFGGPSHRQFPSSYNGPTDLVIRNERQWCQFWELAHGNRTDPPPCDTSLVDFRREAVIATARAGSNGCVTVDLVGLEASEQYGRFLLTALVRDTGPGRGCICSAAFVFRVKAYVVSEPMGLVDFVHEPATLECGER